MVRSTTPFTIKITHFSQNILLIDRLGNHLTFKGRSDAERKEDATFTISNSPFAGLACACMDGIQLTFSYCYEKREDLGIRVSWGGATRCEHKDKNTFFELLRSVLAMP